MTTNPADRFSRSRPNYRSFPRVRRFTAGFAFAAVAAMTAAPLCQTAGARGIPALSRRVGQSLPIALSLSAPLTAGGSPVTATVSVESTGTSVQFGCDRPDLVSNPSGTWPLTVNFPSGGSTSAAVSVAAASVSQDVAVHLYVCPAGVNAGDPNNWTSVKTEWLIAPESAGW